MGRGAPWCNSRHADLPSSGSNDLVLFIGCWDQNAERVRRLRTDRVCTPASISLVPTGSRQRLCFHHWGDIPWGHACRCTKRKKETESRGVHPLLLADHQWNHRPLKKGDAPRKTPPPQLQPAQAFSTSTAIPLTLSWLHPPANSKKYVSAPPHQYHVHLVDKGSPCQGESGCAQIMPPRSSDRLVAVH
ncbi:hypothetical protein VTO42DRAFT_3418 [Malbranchea cinnamomea]